ncbi:MAG: AAA family ATPase [Actinobacteria bacterium]|nr:AAA family ATPase [Actinomycetota bacterium]
MGLCGVCGAENAREAHFCSSCGSPLSAPTGAGETRRVVTILFSDIVDSTPLGERLDPEALRRVMRRYFSVMSAALERHGGTVEKFIGDAVMAVFGIPAVREDDALRAVRAAGEMSAALAALNDELRAGWDVEIRVRTGINTGEVVAGDVTTRQTFATGDAVVVAHRLEQAAGADEILLGEQTYQLVREAVSATPVGALDLKGKQHPVSAWRVVEIGDPPTISRRFDSPLVGRTAERRALHDELERASAQQACRLVTVLGAAGVGKSRLTSEFVGDITARALVLEGRCLNYGEGITYWPIKEIVEHATGISETDSREQARAKIGRLLPDDEHAELICHRVAAVVGLRDEVAGSEETFWGVRRFFEALAREQPLVVIFQDIHWAEPTLLDLIEYMGRWSRGVPILVLSLARPELHETRPSWGAGAPHALSLTLDPLSAPESVELVGNLLGKERLDEASAARIVEPAEGNPLFVQEMLRMLVDEGALERSAGEWRPVRDLSRISMPPTIQALLAARLDRLDEPERAIIQRASIAGKIFWWGAVAELTPAPLRSEVGGRLQDLVRKRLIEPDPTSSAEEDAFRFAHILIRDAAYGGMPKELCADLHAQYAAWLEQKAGERAPELEEILGYHLEQAYRLREQLGPVDEAARAGATRAGELLGSAGRRAFARDDMPAALSLLDRAVSLMTDQHPARLELVRELSGAFWAVGEVARAESLLNGLLEAASAAGDRRIEWYALLERAGRRNMIDPSATADDLLQVTEDAIRVFEELGDDLGLARAWRRMSLAPRARGQFGISEAAVERALHHARRAADGQEEARSIDYLCTILVMGPAPVQDALRRCEEMLAAVRGNRLMEANVATSLAALEAMRGAFPKARSLSERGERIYDDLGLRLALVNAWEIAGYVELLAGDAAAAEGFVRRGYELLAAARGKASVLAFHAALLADALLAQGKVVDADHFARTSEDLAAEDDVEAQVRWRGVRARLLVGRGRSDEAAGLAQRAVELAGMTDALNLHGDALMDLAEVLRKAGDEDAAASAAREAQALYKAKGNVVAARKAASLLGERIG